MPPNVVNGAMLMCTFGAAPGTLTVLPLNKVMVNNQPAANMSDSKPMVNIGTFGMCMSPANPQVAAATAAALGVLTPMPCVPATSAPWVSMHTTMIANQPVLASDGQCICNWGGVITVSFPGQITTQSN